MPHQLQKLKNHKGKSQVITKMTQQYIDEIIKNVTMSIDLSPKKDDDYKCESLIIVQVLDDEPLEENPPKMEENMESPSTKGEEEEETQK